ncbi:MAG: GxxExxY protein [Saprospiraceae bacterium]|nr:GxxExxY protein [Saprospiraceae bacterium]
MEHRELTHSIIGCAMRVHAALGPGLLESAYEACLYYELVDSGLKVHRQVSLPLVYRDVEQDVGYRIDLFVENKIIIELKSLDELHPIHTAQVLTYLKLSNTRLGLLINFNVKSLKDGIKRIVYGYN